MFIGRQQELAFLQDKYEEEESQLIVLYGRRRIGKTEVLSQFCKDKPHFYYSCLKTIDPVQLAKFSARLLKQDIPAKQYLSTFHDWQSAFQALLDLDDGQNKILVVIDEFPNMCGGNRNILSILQSLWDHSFKNRNIMLVLCGSSLSFMEKDLLAKNSPLYGRITGICKMTELEFSDVIRFFPDYSVRDLVYTYSILGGVPYYLKQWNPKLAVSENIKRSILTKDSVLYSEVEFRLNLELRQTAVYNAILEAIGLGNSKLNDISQKAMICNPAKTAVYLKHLIDLGIVNREFSVDAGDREISIVGRGLYRIADPLFRFWYTFGSLYLSELEEGDADGVYDYAIKPYLHRFCALPFETICLQYLQALQKQQQLPFRFSRIGRWFGKTTIRDTKAKEGIRIGETEIDILAVDSGNENILVGECKFKSGSFSLREFLDTKAKLFPLQQSAQFHYYLFSKSGFDPKIKAQNENITLISLEDLVRKGA